MPDPQAVNSMFARIALRYDLANRLLSGGTDLWWRWRLVRRVRRAAPRDVLDLATGSGDVAFALCRAMPGVEVSGMDFCQPMLDQAEAKKAAAGGNAAYPSLRFLQGDGLNLPLPDACVDAVTISFGLRNMADRHRALCEMRRVLRPGGRLYVLEFSQAWGWFRPLYLFYLRHILPPLAGLVTRDRAAYRYLNETIEEFPDHLALAAEIREAGFADVRATRMTGGIVALHQCTVTQ
ncbi:ubiquinone biosynthesis protein [Cephaloticoccus capnophilus]|uniref:Demethylmenaquinone methyltransferase n=1 Tax=Cephaloticoccus capnophilus TaxID=1548208 RepID=A0A139SSC1_9BACT|nr:ubiquinone/menaquinone biosynthesis methyltransferase [Cephaloticoccus capnophilus]KXU37414.1 ubiquinone biosynthesis protein [Cephaloticoccus capnophilus]